MKIAKACVQCRDGKRRCRSDGEGACASCRQRRLSCSRTIVKSPYPRTLLPNNNEEFAPVDSPQRPYTPSVQTLREQDSFSKEQIKAAVTLYLHYIHDRPHSLFHQATLWAEIENGSISNGLLYSICGLGVRLSRDASLRELSPKFEEPAKAHIRENMEDVTLANVQACILLANLCAAELQTQSEVLYFGIANRMAQLLGLHKTNDDDPIVLGETKVRVWWTLVMADKWCSSGLDLPRQLIDPGRYVRMPYDEYEFQGWKAGDKTLTRTPQLGLWAHMIALVEIFEPIQELNRRFVHQHRDTQGLGHQARHLAGLLTDWSRRLPIEMQWSDHNLDAHRARGLGGAFVALHLGFHHYSTVLFFQYLDLERIYDPENVGFAWKCRFHASTFSEILQKSRERTNCEAVYATVGHMTVVSSSVILHTLLFGNNDTVPEARRRLTANFAALVDLRELWPSLSRTINRLFAFQNACINSADPNTYKIDRWMLRFLLEHSVHLGEKTLNSDKEPEIEAASEGTRDGRLSDRRNMSDRALSRLLE